MEKEGISWMALRDCAPRSKDRKADRAWILPHVRFKGLTTEAKLSKSLSLPAFRVVSKISERAVASIRKDHRDDSIIREKLREQYLD